MYRGLHVKKHRVDKIIYHPNWAGENYRKRHSKTGQKQDNFDLAILKTKTKLGVGTKTVQAGKIGTQEEFDAYVKTDKAECQAVGMGIMANQRKNEKLQKTRVWWRELGCTTLKGYEKPKTRTQYKLNKKNCYHFKTKKRDGYWGETFTPLAYDKNIQMERGDSGSPLYCRINGVWKSFGVKCCGLKGGGNKLGGMGFWGVPFAVIDWIIANSDYQGESKKKESGKTWKWGYVYYYKYY